MIYSTSFPFTPKRLHIFISSYILLKMLWNSKPPSSLTPILAEKPCAPLDHKLNICGLAFTLLRSSESRALEIESLEPSSGDATNSESSPDAICGPGRIWNCHVFTDLCYRYQVSVHVALHVCSMQTPLNTFRLAPTWTTCRCHYKASIRWNWVQAFDSTCEKQTYHSNSSHTTSYN